MLKVRCPRASIKADEECGAGRTTALGKVRPRGVQADALGAAWPVTLVGAVRLGAGSPEWARIHRSLKSVRN